MSKVELELEALNNRLAVLIGIDKSIKYRVYGAELAYNPEEIIITKASNKIKGKIKIPYGVTRIGYKSFDGCESITSIELPDSVTEIGVRAFYGCTSITSIYVPDSVTEIINSAFAYCESLTSLSIPKHVRANDDAFDNCPNLVVTRREQ